MSMVRFVAWGAIETHWKHKTNAELEKLRAQLNEELHQYSMHLTYSQGSRFPRGRYFKLYEDKSKSLVPMRGRKRKDYLHKISGGLMRTCCKEATRRMDARVTPKVTEV